mgnify:CR=1 FL=1
MKNKPFRIIGFHNGFPVYLRSYPSHVELSINGTSRQFRDYDSAMMYLRTINQHVRDTERQRHDFKRKR